MNANLAGPRRQVPAHRAPTSRRAPTSSTRPIDILKLRGTIETGFRAPNLQESAPSSKSAFQPRRHRSEALPCRHADRQRICAPTPLDNPDNADEDLRRAEQIQSNECSTSVPIIAQNNPALKPETSISKSFGAVLQVTKHWSFAADYWNIERQATRST